MTFVLVGPHAGGADVSPSDMYTRALLIVE